MRIEEAIEILTPDSPKAHSATFADYDKAKLLAIQALTAYQKALEAGWYPPGYKLPAETDE